jgi:hypothetical protein
VQVEAMLKLGPRSTKPNADLTAQAQYACIGTVVPTALPRPSSGPHSSMLLFNLNSRPRQCLLCALASHPQHRRPEAWRNLLVL